jgi:CubicO group peptidase (beta-lactamase class C family)
MAHTFSGNRARVNGRGHAVLSSGHSGLGRIVMPRLTAALACGLTSLLLAVAASADVLAVVEPGQAGFSADRLTRIGRTLTAEIEARRMPGAVVLLARRGRIGYFERFGALDPAGPAPMSRDAIFRIYSMTKPWTSVAAMMLVEEGRLLLSDPVSKFLPQLARRQVAVESGLVPAQREITIQDLLRHTSGFTYGGRTTNAVVREAYREHGVDALDITNAELIDRIARAPLAHQPGAAFEYGRSTDVLGRVVEVVSGLTLGRFFEARIFRPLKMVDSGFHVPAGQHPRIAQAFAKDVITGRDASMLAVTAPPTYEAGGQGGVATAMDYARFAQMLLDRGVLDGQRLLGRQTVDFMTADHLGRARDTFRTNPGYGFGLGFAVRVAQGVATSPGSVGDYNWAGAGGTYFWVDPKEQLVAVFMAQTPGEIRTHYRTLVRDLVYQAVD